MVLVLGASSNASMKRRIVASPSGRPTIIQSLKYDLVQP